MERRHVLLERIADIQPHYIDLNESGHFLRTVTAVQILPEEAQQLVVKAIEETLRTALGEVELMQATEIYYDVVAAAGKTMPLYHFYMESKEVPGAWLVFLNESVSSLFAFLTIACTFEYPTKLSRQPHSEVRTAGRMMVIRGMFSCNARTNLPMSGRKDLYRSWMVVLRI